MAKRHRPGKSINPANNNEHDQASVVKAILKKQEELSTQLHDVQTSIETRQKQRDIVIAAVGIVVTFLGVYVSYRHNTEEKRIEEARTLQGLVPAIAGPDATGDTRRAAVTVIKSHRNPNLSAIFAVNLSDLGEYGLALDIADSALRLALAKSWLENTKDDTRKAYAGVVAQRAEAKLKSVRASAKNGTIGIAQAQNQFDGIWNELRTLCGDVRLADAGKRCIGERQRGGRFDWFREYRDQMITSQSTEVGEAQK